MSKVTVTAAAFVLCLVLGTTGASATSVGLAEWAVNLDGTLATPSSGPVPDAIDTSRFDFTTGLGTIIVTLTSAGPRFVGAFLDHDIGAVSFIDEFGALHGTLESGQSWEIDAPGFPPLPDDIFTHFTDSDATASQLDNMNGVPDPMQDDVSMALGWNFTVPDGQSAVVSFIVSRTTPPGGFFLTQTDLDSHETIYFATALSLGDLTPIPEPGTLALLGSGLLGLALWRRRRRQRYCGVHSVPSPSGRGLG